MNDIFLNLSIIIGLASILAIIFNFFKQPTILAYILAGIIIGYFSIHIDEETLHNFSQIGVSLLLFLLGLELKVSELRLVGKVAFITGMMQVLFTSLVGFIVIKGIGFDTTSAIYIGVALTFSSTIVIVKLLSDKKDLNSLHGKLAVGMLLVQDFFAVMSLIFVSAFAKNSTPNPVDFGFIILKAVILFLIVIVLSQFVFPKLIHKISHSQELLFISSLAWAFGLATFVSSEYIGFSIEIGGFLAGLSLSNSLESISIASKIKPLRDFFIVIFFVVLGTNLEITQISNVIIPGVILSTFVLVGNPLIIMFIMRYFGYRKKTSFYIGVHLAQISEFSLIFLFLAEQIGHVKGDVIPLMTLITAITFTLSTYAVSDIENLYKFFEPTLWLFEKKKLNNKEEEFKSEDLENHTVLIGAHRMGSKILDAISNRKKLIIVDINPETVDNLNNRGYYAILGDISNEEVQEKTQIFNAKLVISTIPDISTNINLLNKLKHEKSNAKTIIVAHYSDDENDLYKAGASNVIKPYDVAGEAIADMLDKTPKKIISSLNTKRLSRILNSDIKALKR